MLAKAIRNNFKDIEIVVGQTEDKVVVPVELNDDVIVENPDELVVQFPIVSDIQLEEKLPFFKSIMVKLANI